MLRIALAAALIATPAIAFAQDQAAEEAQTTTPQRIRNVQLAPGQPCPRSTADEVVVCGTLEEPYRIPKELRKAPAQTPESTSWAVKTDRVMEENRKVIPGSCSAIGSYGHTGCTQAAIDAWNADRQEAKRTAPQGR